ncbi:DUF6864 domain-containing function [Lelliottia aquatilis]|uniref:DUF6864 domain-containing function n=1 Tax=Lelliottia aquatilis TaxID=2080838 RepID=UPI00192C2F9A|nr:hypothetical protein [Lelliottia aquatilis]MBL5882584.1 hypothetical protein [Lelliottia aquatilis]
MSKENVVKEITINNKIIVLTQTILVPNISSSINFKMIDDKFFYIRFKNDSKNKTSRYEGNPSDDGQSYTLSFINFNNSLGEGFFEPFDFYNVDGLQYYINVWVQSVNENNRIITFNIVRD